MWCREEESNRDAVLDRALGQISLGSWDLNKVKRSDLGEEEFQAKGAAKAKTFGWMRIRNVWEIARRWTRLEQREREEEWEKMFSQVLSSRPLKDTEGHNRVKTKTNRQKKNLSFTETGTTLVRHICVSLILTIILYMGIIIIPQEKWDLERLINMTKVRQLLSVGAGIWTQACLIPEAIILSTMLLWQLDLWNQNLHAVNWWKYCEIQVK